MSFLRALLRILPAFLLIYIAVSLVLGYWDMRLSDHYLYQNQMARIHYLRTIVAHLILGILLGIFFAIAWAIHDSKSNTSRPVSSIIKTQTPLSIALILFLIVGIKAHLIWLDTHLLDPEGILWTLVILFSSGFLFWILWLLLGRLEATGQFIMAGIAMLLVALTIQNAYQAISLPPSASATKRPNVLLIVIDTLRSDHVSAYGYQQKTTPWIDAFAKQSVQYQTAISQSPWTTPSHAALFTGQYPSRNGVDGKNIHLHSENKTMAEVLEKNGYQTAGFINNVYIRRQTGLAQGFQQYEEFWGRNEGSSLMLLVEFLNNRWDPRSDKGADETIDAVADWLDHDWNPKNSFFLFAHFMEPHAIYGSTGKYVKEFLPAGVSAPDAMRVNQDPEMYICGKIQMTERDFGILGSLYNSDIRYLDDAIGDLIDTIRKKGLIDNTIVILTADHGENFGEHHLMSHELSLYDTLLHVPLLIHFPQRIQMSSVQEKPVQLIDIFPSLLQVLNIKNEGLTLQGTSLLPGEVAKRPDNLVFAEYNNSRAVDNIERKFGDAVPPNPIYLHKILKVVRSDKWKFIWGTDGTRELYAINKDPYEKNNLSQLNQDEAKQMETALKAWVSSFTPSHYYRQEEISPEARQELRSLGYIQ